MQDYFDRLNDQLHVIYNIAEKARKQGLDPSLNVETPIAKDIADRVEGLIGPEGVGVRIRELEKQNLSREQVAFRIAGEICDQQLIKGAKEILADQALRTSLAVITESITAAPIEGIAKVKIKQNDDGTDYLAVYYSGPIRSAGGTAAGMSVLLGDFIRKRLKIGKYQPDQREVERYVEELELYNRVSHLQLPTTKEEQRFAAQNLPIEISGEPTDKVEVTGNRDLRRIETNRLRGGACLVFNDGLVGRSKKLIKKIKENKLDGWDWLNKLIEIHGKSSSVSDEESDTEFDEEEEMEIEVEEEIASDMGYIKDVIGGRPVFAHPSEKGGFRLRYGRSRTTGLAGMGIHPALMGLVDDFLACGTHVRTERPGKGAIVMPVDSIHPPIVKLKNGDVVKIESYAEAIAVRENLLEILFLGDMLYGVGEFNQNNFDLIPSGYCEEWWAQELEKAFVDYKETTDIKINNKLLEKIDGFIHHPHNSIPSPQEALELSDKLDLPLHPEYTYHWSDISIEEYKLLRNHIKSNSNFDTNILEIEHKPEVKKILESICIPHKLVQDKIVLDLHSLPLLNTIGYVEGKLLQISKKKGRLIDLINSLKNVNIRNKCPVYTGARMGRPEKAKDRRMKPPVQLLFPIGDAGGRLRDLFVAATHKNINVELSRRLCPSCGTLTHNILCSTCNAPTIVSAICSSCNLETTEDRCSKCGRMTQHYQTVNYPLANQIEEAKKRIGPPIPKKVKTIKKLMNKLRAPELIDKGILRAKHDLFVYRDGTIRFDSTDAVLTHFKPSEIGATIQQLHDQGYSADINGKPLVSSDQIVELKIQDIVLNIDGGHHLARVTNFIDELLEKVYGLPHYYNVKKPSDLIGKLVMGLAPHTSAGIVGRIIGFTKAKVNFAHPYWHAAKRRNCLSKDEEILIWDNNARQLIRKNIGEIVDELVALGAQQEIVDDYGTLAIENLHPHWEAVSIDEATNQAILQPIKHWIKGNSEQWIKIRTETGRTIKMTPNHNALIWNPSSKLTTTTKAKYLQIGDYIPIVRKTPIPIIQPPANVNILKELSSLPDTAKFLKFKHQVRLRGANSWMKAEIFAFAKRKNIIDSSKEYIKFPKQIREYFLNILPEKPMKQPLSSDWFKSIPLSHLKVLQEINVFQWDDVPPGARLGMARDDHTVSPYMPFTTDLMRLLGYLIAEGYIRDERTCYQTNFSVPNPVLRKHVRHLIITVLGSKPYHKKDNHQLVHTGRIHAYLFAYKFGIGRNAYSKRLPNFSYSLPEDYKYSLLSAYIDGDGSIPSSDSSIIMYSVSKKLLEDIGLLLNSLGIFYRKRKESPPAHYGKKILARYKELKKTPKQSIVHRISIRGPDLKILTDLVFYHKNKQKNANRILRKGFSKKKIIRKTDGTYLTLEESSDIIVDTITNIEIENTLDNSYCLETSSKNEKPTFHNFSTTSLLTVNCDGDEDSCILALDAFLNFSRSYLPEIRGGKMDAPLILVSNLNPHEVDDESHNVDTCVKYPLTFYEATLARKSPKDVLTLIDMISNRLSDESAYEGFLYSHETSHIFEGPESTAYKNLKTMSDKVYAQLHVAKLIKAADIKDVATKIIENHFIPDMIGNLRAFGSQKIRCTNCGNKTYRRMPLTGVCSKCGEAKLNLTVYPASVSKYFAMASSLVEEYDLSEYLKNRLAIMKHNLESLFGEEALVSSKGKEPKKIKESVQLSKFFKKYSSDK
jgi:DNA polymerase II large subunit